MSTTVPALGSSLFYGALQKSLLEQIERNYRNFKKEPKARRTRAVASSRLALLEENMASAKIYHQNVVGGSKLEAGIEKEDYFEVFDKINDTYLDYRSDLTELLESLSAVPATSALAAGQAGQSLGQSGMVRTELRLPKIDLPKFNGDYTKWRSFHDRFDSLVCSNHNLTDIDKMHFLKSSLEGEADRLLQHLPCVAGNFDKAWELLKARYDNKRVLVNAQLKLLFSQKCLVKESVDELKEVIFTSQECIHALRNLDVPVDQWDVILVHIVYNKLPCNLQQLWEEKLGNQKELPNWNDFLEFLEARFRTLEAVCADTAQPTSFKNDVRRPAGTEVRKVFHVKNAARTEFVCQVCHQSQHSLRKCQKFLNMDVQRRAQVVKTAKVCNNCLGYSHFASNCPSDKNCTFCSKRHHSLLHINTPPQPSQPRRQTSFTATQVSVNPDAPEFHMDGRASSSGRDLNTFHASAGSCASAKVLLATAVVKVMAADGSFHCLRALVDPGSEATFITTAAAQLLNLKRCQTVARVSGLGLVSSGTTYSSVDLTLASQHSTFEGAVRALVFTSLTGHLPAHRIDPKKWQHLEGLCLADPTYFLPAPVDLLLGSDVFADILLPQVVRSQDGQGPVAQKTHLGWIIFGKVPTETPVHVRTFTQFADLRSEVRGFQEAEEVATAEEERSIQTHAVQMSAKDNRILDVMQKFSKLLRVIRKIASYLRSAFNCRKVRGFLAACKRFTRRRGVCRRLHIDCGTNFVSDNAELGRILENAKHCWKEVAEELSNHGTEWHFIPPASPHFGGLWEAGVKPVKYHIKQVVGSEILTIKELATLLTEVEACLNSRPLCPLTDNVDDLDVLTPANCLIGEQIHALPQRKLTHNITHLERWKRIQVLADQFWKKWHSEYLCRLQQRPKWINTEKVPNVGDLVLIKDERLSATYWNMARITETHPGSDGLIPSRHLEGKKRMLKASNSKIMLAAVKPGHRG